MKMLKSVTAIIVIGLVMAVAIGCGMGKKYVGQLADLEKKTCACADKGCADGAFKDFLVIIEDMNKTQAKVTDSDGKKIGESTTNIVKCLMTKGISPQTIQQELLKYKK
jgi:hypothetical protein